MEINKHEHLRRKFDRRNASKPSVVNSPPSYSLASTDYHLFRSLENGLSDVSFHNDVQLRKWLGD